MIETKNKIIKYKELITQVDRELNIIMAELHALEQKKNNIMQKIDSILTEKKMENIRKKYLNK